MSVNAKPCVFIGSSSEGLRYAKAVQQNLDHTAETIVWNQGVFAPSSNAITSLLEIVDELDFAALVVGPDDLVVSRGVEHPSPRDNVLLEIGLFAGRLGISRTFLLVDRSVRVKLPTDLAGVTICTFEPPVNGTYQSAIGAACSEVEEAIGKLGPRRPTQRIALSSSFFTSVDGAGIKITVTNKTGAEMPPYVPTLFHPERGTFLLFASERSGVLYDGQFREHRLVFPSLSRKEAPLWDKTLPNGMHLRMDAKYGTPHEHLEAHIVDEDTDLNSYIFRLQVESSDRMLLESRSVGAAIAKYMRATVVEGKDLHPDWLISEACRNP